MQRLIKHYKREKRFLKMSIKCSSQSEADAMEKQDNINPPGLT